MLKIKDLKLNETVDLFLMVSKMTEKEATNGKPYVEFSFEDGEDKVDAKMWNSKLENFKDIAIGSIIKVRAKVGEWNNKTQLTLGRYRVATNEDDFSADDFVRKAPVEAVFMYDSIINYVNNFSNDDLKNLTSNIVTQNKEKLLYYPGAQLVHHNIKSGLLFHIFRMLESGMKLTEIYPGLNKDLFFAGIILHDIGKLEELNSNINGQTEDYTKEGKLLGHIAQGIKLVSLTAFQLRIDSEVSLLIEHMIASHHYEESFGSFKKPMFLEAELLHYIDMIDARVYLYQECTKNVEDGSFSDKEYFLQNRQVYKHCIS